MPFKIVTAKEWKALGLPPEISTIHFNPKTLFKNNDNQQNYPAEPEEINKENKTLEK
jgi:hypothetical protein